MGHKSTRRRAARESFARLEGLEGRRLMCSIGDFVWLDADCDGIQDNGEAGVPNVKVNLYDSSGTLVDTETTDANGYYLFDGPGPDGQLWLDTFTVQFELPSGYHFSPANQGGNDAADSDAGAGGFSGPVVLTEDNLHDLTVDAGLCVDVEQHVAGRMTGGGSVFLKEGMIGGPVGTRVTHGFELHCTTEANNHLEINWGKPNNHFHLADLTAVECEDTAIIQNPPDAPIDTLKATGVGRFSGTVAGNKYLKAPATVQFVFRDGGPTRGEPGIYDVASYKVTLDGSGLVVLNTDGTDADSVPDELLLQFGNHQAHYEIKRLTTSAARLQRDINSVFDQLDNPTQTDAKILSLTQQLLDLQSQFEVANA
jgi:hypothetical protein